MVVILLEELVVFILVQLVIKLTGESGDMLSVFDHKIGMLIPRLCSARDEDVVHEVADNGRVALNRSSSFV